MNGHAAVEPAISLMNSRRFMGVLAEARDHATRLRDDTLHRGLGVGLDDTQKAVIGDTAGCPLWVISGRGVIVS